MPTKHLLQLPAGWFSLTSGSIPKNTGKEFIFLLRKQERKQTIHRTAKYPDLNEYSHERPLQKKYNLCRKVNLTESLSNLTTCSTIIKPSFLFHPALVYMTFSFLWSAAHLCWTSLVYYKANFAGWCSWTEHRRSLLCIMKTLWGSHLLDWHVVVFAAWMADLQAFAA